MHLHNNQFSDLCHLLSYGKLKPHSKQGLLNSSRKSFCYITNELAKVKWTLFWLFHELLCINEGKFTKLWFSQNCDKFFCFFFFYWFCNISTHISSNFLATLRLIIIMFGPLNKNDQKILLTLCTKFKTPVAPSKPFSKLLKFCMVYFITKINKMRDEEVKHLTFDFSWITLMYISESFLRKGICWNCGGCWSYHFLSTWYQSTIQRACLGIQFACGA